MTREDSDFYTCVNCKERRTADELRYPGVTKAAPRMVCRQCRLNNPDQGWCNGDRTFHPLNHFYKDVRRVDGHTESCRAVLADQQWATRHKTTMQLRYRTCMACNQERPVSSFKGTRHKRHVCVPCADSHPDQSWCAGCKDWALLEWFDISSRERPMSWCALCWALRTHGTTLAAVLELQESPTPACAVCGLTERRKLCVDHDHRCCPMTGRAGNAYGDCYA